MTAFGSSTKGRTFPVEILTPAEVRQLMQSCSRRGNCGVRDRAMIATMFRAGLRVSELIALAPKDVDCATGEVRVLRGKGGKQRLVGVDAETAVLIELWLARRAEHGISSRAPLFCTLRGSALSRVQITQKLKALAAAAGIEKRVHPHGLRHARAVDLVRNNVPLPTIQAAYGHSSLRTTQVYVQHLAPAEVVEAMRGGAW